MSGSCRESFCIVVLPNKLPSYILVENEHILRKLFTFSMAKQIVVNCDIQGYTNTISAVIADRPRP